MRARRRRGPKRTLARRVSLAWLRGTGEGQRLRRFVAFWTCALFLWSTAAIFPRSARADEIAPTPATVEAAAEQVVPQTVPTAALPPPTSTSKSEPPPMAPGRPDVAKSFPDLAPATPKTPPLDEAKSLPTGADKSGVTSQAISVPQGTGKIQGMGESFSAQLSTGIATYTVPFALPSARGGAQPSLSLSYSSSGSHGIAGVGWEIGAPFIARQTDRGLPSYSDGLDWTAQQDRFVFNGGQELVPICKVSGGSCSGALPGEVMPGWADGYQYFRPRVEGSFLRFFWSLDHRTWIVQSKTGETMELGVPLDGSGYTSGLETDPANTKKIYRWLLTRHYDVQRVSGAPVNIVAYRYLNLGGISYLTDIYDTPPATDPSTAALASYAHHTKLRYEGRADVTSGYRRGWRVTQTMRLAGVDVTSKTFAADGARELVRRYHLSYDANYHVSLLTRVQMEGRCASNPAEDGSELLPPVTGCGRLPAMRFDYQHVEPFTTTGAAGVADLPGYEGFDERVRAMGSSPPFSLDEELTDLFDVNADGLPDVLVTA